MSIRVSRAFVFTLAWTVAGLLAGCHSAQQPPPGDPAAATTESEADEAQRIADTALGKQAEILERGDLARNGREQLLIINRYGAGPKVQSRALVTRAVVLEKNDGKWREIFRCDEHLKNPYGYLIAGGSTVTGWELLAGRDPSGALEMEFTSAALVDAADTGKGGRKVSKAPTFVVRWNTKANRYQAYDRAQKRYLNETTALEMPQSTLR